MIIECLNCNKKFNVDAVLIPEEGRLIQCGSCDHSWHYKIEKFNPQSMITHKDNNEKMPILEDAHKNKDEINTFDDESPAITKQETITEKIKIKKNINIDNKKVENKSVVNFFSYLLVFIISFVAMVILIDTLRSPLISFYPELEVILFNLFETLKDVKLFIIDLI